MAHKPTEIKKKNLKKEIKANVILYKRERQLWLLPSSGLTFGGQAVEGMGICLGKGHLHLEKKHCSAPKTAVSKSQPGSSSQRNKGEKTKMDKAKGKDLTILKPSQSKASNKLHLCRINPGLDSDS